MTATEPILRYANETTRRILEEHSHSPESCEPPCALHAPSEHHMLDWPLNYRWDRGLLERICPCGIGHPDPDHMARVERLRGKEFAEAEGVHGCCGHCSVGEVAT